MTVFKPELCVLRKTRPEHYDIDQVRAFAVQYKFNAANLRLGKKALCAKLKERYLRNQAGPPRVRNANQAGPSRVRNANQARPSKVKKGKNRNELLANRSPLALNMRENPKQFRNFIKSCVKQRTLTNKSKQMKRTLVKKNLMKYHRNRNYKYKPIENQMPWDKKNPLTIRRYDPHVIMAVLIQFGEISNNNINQEQRYYLNRINDKQFMKGVIEYQSYKNNPTRVIESIEVPRTWKPTVGNKKLNLIDTEKELTCHLKHNLKLFLDTIVYIDSEVIDDTIYHVYNIKNLLTHMKNKGYCPAQPWKQLTPNNIKSFNKNLISNLDLDVQGLLYVRELQKIQNSNLLITVEKMLSKVHTINNRFRVVIHAETNNNIKERRGNCGAAVIELYDFIQEQHSLSDKKALLTELGESLPVCIEAKCNYIREFIEEKKGSFQFNYNSKMPKDRIIADACIFYIKKWCTESETKEENKPTEESVEANPRQYFLGKLPDLFTRVQAKLQNKNSKNGKIDYLDILRVILEQGEYMINCGNHNFSNINLNTNNMEENERMKRELFGMVGIR